MKRILTAVAVFFLSAPFLHAGPSYIGGECLNPSGDWIPIASTGGTDTFATPQMFGVLGVFNGTWQGLQCDASGNLIVSGGGTTTSAATFNNGNAGAASPATFNGSAPVTISANTLGAASLGAPNTFTAFPQTFNGDTSASPSFTQFITSTNSGSTTGIPAGSMCVITHTFSSGTNWSAFGVCVTAGGTNQDYTSSAHALNSEAFALASTLSVNSTISSYTVNVFKSTAAKTVVNCSTSGTATFAQPQQGTSDMKAKAYLAACVGTASYTFPTAFSFTPAVVTTNEVSSGVVTTLSTTAMTVTGATTTGFVLIEGW